MNLLIAPQLSSSGLLQFSLAHFTRPLLYVKHGAGPHRQFNKRWHPDCLGIFTLLPTARWLISAPKCQPQRGGDAWLPHRVACFTEGPADGEWCSFGTCCLLALLCEFCFPAHPRCFQACRSIPQRTDVFFSPEALNWRKRVVS